MGCCVSTLPAVDPDLIPASLPQGVTRLTPQSDPALIEEAVDMLTKSFAGSTTSAPEGNLSWVFDPEASVDNDPCKPLKADPTTQRLKFFRFVVEFCFKVSLPQGTVFVLKKNGQVVGVSVCCPPNTKNRHSLGGFSEICYFIGQSMKGKIPGEVESGPVKKRMDALDKLMKEKHPKYPHWYVYCFGVDSTRQGQGNGREMMEFVGMLGSHSNHPMYLETAGPRNLSFYKKNGFEVVETTVVSSAAGNFDVHGGVTSMVKKAGAGI